MVQSRRSVRPLGLSLIALAGFFGAMAVSAETIAIVGTGNVANVLGPGFAGLGHDIVYGSREPSREDVQELVRRTGENATVMRPTDAVRDADIVVLAVPGTVVQEVVENLGDLSGKIVIDPTNPTRTNEQGLRISAVATSNGEIIQQLAPDAFVVKAFNTMGVPTMGNPEAFNAPIAVPLVGNDAEAKAKVAELARGIGLEPQDMGPIRFSRTVEGMLLLLIYARGQGSSVDFAFATRNSE